MFCEYCRTINDGNGTGLCANCGAPIVEYHTRYEGKLVTRAYFTTHTEKINNIVRDVVYDDQEQA